MGLESQISTVASHNRSGHIQAQARSVGSLLKRLKQMLRIRDSRPAIFKMDLHAVLFQLN